MFGMACADMYCVNTRRSGVMGYLIDLMYLLKELLTLVVMVMISPLGIMAGFLIAWE